ncbi:glycosyltransferase family 39 protein [Gluconobacter morbifer]|uniref:Glycosyltransferase RgtA/B/C/D-like domain-containing protein n=1 Tax=Gluconobacter morbifer G707 TaxID=1088869 RepID=G6XII1_9PROT|nr:glycosyltransferase family 39 protein [Gluconobacter morbifer]EHH68621.1 hypothetical protein GMO_13910 [Gluconobacter morbifer G707]
MNRTPLWEEWRLFWALLLVLMVLRLFMAAFLPLMPDEAYYWVWSRHLQGGYLDHPFMVALWIRIGTWFCGDTPLGVRFLGPLSVLPGSWALYHAARRLLPSIVWPLSGWRAALLLNSTLMLGLGAATMTPDTPLVFFVACALYTLSRAVEPAISPLRALPWWLLTGVLLGLGFDSKYTAVLLVAALGGAVLTTARFRRQPGPWLAIPVFLAATTPVLVWNAGHHWASFMRQGGRAGDWHPARAFQFLGELIGGQIGLATPLIFVLFGLGIMVSVRRNRLLAWLALLPLAVFVFHAFGDRVQANWPAVLYPVLALAAVQTGRRVKWAAASGLFLTGLVCLQALCSLLPLSPHRDPVLRQTGGWNDFARQIALKARQEGATALVVEDYGLASELALNQTLLPVLGTDPRWALFHLPRQTVAQALTVTEDRSLSAPSGADALCRSRRGRFIRCYRLKMLVTVTGIQLPARI